MSFASLLHLAIVILVSVTAANAATVFELCAQGRHCIYGPASKTRIDDVTINPTKGQVLLNAEKDDGRGAWLLSNGASGNLGVQCKASPQRETWAWFFDQAGGVNTLRGADNNTGFAAVAFGGMSAVKGGGEEKAQGAGVDIYIACP